MATQSIKYVFKATKYFKTTIHYSLVTETPKPLISNKLNIAESRDFAKSKPLFWCKEHNGKKWISPSLTGLFKTHKENVYWGCRGRYQDLMLFVFQENQDSLIVYYFKDFFTRNLDPIIKNL